MDIPDQGQEVVVFVADNGLVAIFEQMARQLVSPVMVNRVTGQQFPHDR